MTIDPYALLAGMPELTLEITRLPDDEMGRWVPDRKTILLDDRLSQAERRCTLVHEMVHHLNGDHPGLEPELEAAQERACHERAARLLIPIRALAEALVWSEHADEIAEELWVDEATFWDRIDHLTVAEQAYLRERVQAVKEQIA